MSTIEIWVVEIEAETKQRGQNETIHEIMEVKQHAETNNYVILRPISQLASSERFSH